MYRTSDAPLNGYKDLEWAIQKAGAWFIGSFMCEFVDEYEKFQNKESKKEFIEYFFKEYDSVTEDIQQLRNRINLAIRIIESGMVKEAMKFVINTSDDKIGTTEAKINAQFLLDRLESGETKLPVFE